MLQDTPEPVTPLTVIRDTHAPGTTGRVGAHTAQRILDALAAAGFTVGGDFSPEWSESFSHPQEGSQQ